MDQDNQGNSVEVEQPVTPPFDATDTGATIASGVTAAAGTGDIISAGGITFNLLFDTAALAAPASFRTAMEQAALLLAQAVSDKITVNLNIDYSGAGGGASAGPDAGLYEPYSTVRTDLTANATPGDPTFSALPNTATLQGQSQVAVWNAQLKLLGLMAANDTTTNDASATFSTDIAAGALVGVALHEFTHALGRIPYGPSPDIFDLFRFTGAGTRLFSGQIPSAAAYFSVDGGATKLADYGQNSDPSDFLNSGVQGSNDAFDEFYSGSTLQTLSSVDLEQLDALGFHVVTTANLTIGLAKDTGASSSDKLTNVSTFTGQAISGRTVALSDNGAPAGSATTSAAGIWTATPALADGQHTITVSEVNNLNQTVTASLSFWLATKAPTISATASVSGQTTLTSDTITVAAAAESVGANAIAGVEIFDGAADLGAATLAGGSWTYTAQKLLAGTHNFTAKATDLAGNVASSALPQLVVSGATPATSYILSAFDVAAAGVTDTRPKGINSAGEIVGYYADGRADDIGADGATYYEHGFASTLNGTSRQFTSIDDPDSPTDSQDGESGGPDRTRAFAVNDKGDIVGWFAQDETGLSSAGASYTLPDAGFIDSASWPGTYGTLGFTALNDFGTHALGINTSDQIVGYYNDGSGAEHGFLRNFTGYGVRGDYLSFDIANSIATVAEGINDSGKIVGYYQAADLSYHGFLYDSVSGTQTPIDFNGATNTEALGINNAGQIVGYYTDSAGTKHGFVRSSTGQLTTVDDPNAGPGGTLVGGINDAGEIVGWYTAADGHDHGFTGVTAAPAIVPVTVRGAAGAIYGFAFTDTVAGAAAGAAVAPLNTAIAANQTASLILPSGGSFAIPAGNLVAAVTATAPVTIFGGAAGGQFVIAGSAGLAFNAGAGAGSVFATGGNNLVSAYSGSGSQYIQLGNGSDTVIALAGNDTIAGGSGTNQFLTGAGNDVINTNGTDLIAAGAVGAATITAGSNNPTVFLGPGTSVFNAGTGHATVVGGAGADTINAKGNTQIWLGAKTDNVVSSGADTVIGSTGAATVTASGNSFVFAGSGKLNFTETAGAQTILGAAAGTMTLAGGAGSVIALSYGKTQFTGGAGAATIAGYGGSLTISGGSGSGLYLAGTAGNNSITGGAGQSIILGTAAGDILTAGTSAGDVIEAGAGAETISAAGTRGAHKLYGGTGPNLIRTGTGSANVLLGSGSTTLVAGGGLDLYAFTKGHANAVVIQNFSAASDYLSFVGFNTSEATSALAGATTTAGSEHLTLSDGTSITFQGFTGLTKANIL